MRVAVIGLGYVGLPLPRAARRPSHPCWRREASSDIKNMWRDVELPGELRLWTL